MADRNPFADVGTYTSRKTRTTPTIKGQRPPSQKAATYRIGEPLIQRINDTAQREHVAKADFVKALLMYALDRLDEGVWTLPVSAEKTQHRLDI